MFQAIMLIVSGNSEHKPAEDPVEETASVGAFAVPAGATQVTAEASLAAAQDSDDSAEDDLSLDSLLDTDLDTDIDIDIDTDLDTDLDIDPKTDAEKEKSFFDALDADSPEVKSKG